MTVETPDAPRASFGRRCAQAVQQFLPFALTAPVAVGGAIIVLLAAILTHGSGVGWAAGAVPTLDDGRWWTVFSALAVSQSPITAAVSVVLFLTAGVAAERTLGHRRLLLLATVGAVSVAILAVLGQAGIARWPGLEDADTAVFADPTIALTLVIAAASERASTLWRRRIRLVAGAIVGVFALYAGDFASWVRAIAFVVGLVIGGIATGKVRDAQLWRSTLTEQRTLVAGFVALVGIGPLAALVTGDGRGPLALVSNAFADFDKRLVARCESHYLPLCDHQTALELTRGVGPALLAVVPLVLLIVAAIRLRSGRRAGRTLAIVTAGVLATAALSSAVSGAVVIPGTGAAHAIESVLWAIGAIGLPLAVIGVLFWTGRAFRVTATRAATPRVTIVIVTSFVALTATYLIAEALLRPAWTTRPNLGQSLWETLRRFLPPALLYDAGQPPFPHHGPGLFVWQWVGVVFWVIVVASVFWLYRQTTVSASANREELLAVIAAGDGGTLEWLNTWSGVHHWFSPERDAVVGYRVEAGVALAVSDPISSADRREETMRGFTTYAIDRGWIPVFYSVHDDTRDIAAAWGWSSMVVAEETVIRPQQWSMAGKAGEKVRHPVTRMQREGVTALWTTWGDLSARHNLQIRVISEQWVAERALPEMGFTLGSVPEMQDDRVRLMLAIDPDDNVLGVTSWLPSWQNGELVGWTLDVMRRAPEAPNGVMEFLIASSALQMKEDGITILSLSGAPLTTTDGAEEAGSIAALLTWLSAALEPLYGFASLFRFKKKFRPEYRTLSMVYPDPMQLGTIGIAVARAYLPSPSRKEALALARGLVNRKK